MGSGGEMQVGQEKEGQGRAEAGVELLPTGLGLPRWKQEGLPILPQNSRSGFTRWERRGESSLDALCRA